MFLVSRLTLDEIAAAAELILAQDVAEGKQEGSGSESSDEGFGGEVESDSEEDHVETDLNMEDLADSGYGANTAGSSTAMETRCVWNLVEPCPNQLTSVSKLNLTHT